VTPDIVFSMIDIPFSLTIFVYLTFFWSVAKEKCGFSPYRYTMLGDRFAWRLSH